MIALALAIGVSYVMAIAAIWKTWTLRRRTIDLWARTDDLAVQLETCTTDRNQARTEVEALRLVLARLGWDVQLTWTADAIAEAHVLPVPKPTTPVVWQPWVN